ncbi:MAG: hypothetical protein QOI20_1858, partial [Acidimicrobiaceae bacterium]|nr:hypothetical protein [Acidimicrobiaceae bacterium]
EMGGKKGRMVIDFAGLEDLERLYTLITEPPTPSSPPMPPGPTPSLEGP